jgi:beta-glucosidase
MDFSVSCKFEVQNVGDISGLEIAQCYVSFAEAQQDDPCKTLQGFAKEEIGANQIQKIEIILNARNFSYWSVETNTWQIRKGSYRIHIGSSSENIFLEASINLEQALEVL